MGTGRMASNEWPGWNTEQRRGFLLSNEFTVMLRGREFPSESRIEVVPGVAYGVQRRLDPEGPSGYLRGGTEA